MRKLQTLEEMTAGKTEFQKFVFFTRRLEVIDEMRQTRWQLYEYGGLSFEDIRKRMKVSKKRWTSYFDYSIPVPISVHVKFFNEFDTEIRAARKKISEIQLAITKSTVFASIARDFERTHGRKLEMPTESSHPQTSSNE